MRNVRKLASALLAAALTVAPLGAAEYWIDPVRGDDANPGSQARPFKTISRATNCCLTMTGDVVYALPGIYNSGGEDAVIGLGGVSLIGSGAGRTCRRTGAITGSFGVIRNSSANTARPWRCWRPIRIILRCACTHWPAGSRACIRSPSTSRTASRWNC